MKSNANGPAALLALVNITASFHRRLAQWAGGHFFLSWCHWEGQTRRKMCIYPSQLRAAVNLCSIVLIMCKQHYFWVLPPVSVLLQFAFYRFSFLETSCRLGIGYMHTVFIEIVYIYQNLIREMEVNRGSGDMWRKRWDSQVEVRWLLTNRKHGGKTKSVSVLKAALKKNGGMGERTEKLIVNG